MARIRVSAESMPSRITREDGACLRVQIEAHWQDTDGVVVDFEGQRVASLSFFDASFGALARAHSVDELRRRVQVENIDPMDRSLLNQLVHAGVRERELAGSARPAS